MIGLKITTDDWLKYNPNHTKTLQNLKRAKIFNNKNFNMQIYSMIQII